MNENQLKTGSIYAFATYFMWGFFPLFWKLLAHVPTLQLLSYRILWAFVFYTVIIAYKNRKLIFISSKLNKNSAGTLTVASIILMINWMIYIYAVNSGQIVESSLGYFINPLINILFGVFFFKEKLNRNEIIASLLAAIGVAIITYDQGRPPWIALSLALTFAAYGSLKKNSSISGTESNQFESLVLILPAAVFLLTQEATWLTSDKPILTGFLFVVSGILTGLPLIFFAEAVKRIPYYLMGFFQFIAPTLQFATGVLIFNEHLSPMKLKGFIFIWLAIGFLLITKASSHLKHRRSVRS